MDKFCCDYFPQIHICITICLVKQPVSKHIYVDYDLGRVTLYHPTKFGGPGCKTAMPFGPTMTPGIASLYIVDFNKFLMVK